MLLSFFAAFGRRLYYCHRERLSHHKYILFFLHMYVRCAQSLRLGGSNQPRLHTNLCSILVLFRAAQGHLASFYFPPRVF